jgi:hypothetical protein
VLEASLRQKRAKRFTMRMTPEERRMLDDVAKRNGFAAADAVRLLIRNEHERGPEAFLWVKRSRDH